MLIIYSQAYKIRDITRATLSQNARDILIIFGNEFTFK